VLLDDTGVAYGSDQLITDIRDAEAYKLPTSQVPARIWDATIGRISTH